MGKLIIFLRYVFFLFSSDINEKRKHIHVRDRKGRITNLCKFWLEPVVEMEYNHGFTAKEIIEIQKLVIENYDVILQQVTKFHSGKPVKAIHII